jgi:hypothetical protein
MELTMSTKKLEIIDKSTYELNKSYMKENKLVETFRRKDNNHPFIRILYNYNRHGLLAGFTELRGGLDDLKTITSFTPPKKRAKHDVSIPMVEFTSEIKPIFNKKGELTGINEQLFRLDGSQYLRYRHVFNKDRSQYKFIFRNMILDKIAPDTSITYYNKNTDGEYEMIDRHTYGFENENLHIWQLYGKQAIDGKSLNNFKEIHKDFKFISEEGHTIAANFTNIGTTIYRKDSPTSAGNNFPTEPMKNKADKVVISSPYETELLAAAMGITPTAENFNPTTISGALTNAAFSNPLTLVSAFF